MYQPLLDGTYLTSVGGELARMVVLFARIRCQSRDTV